MGLFIGVTLMETRKKQKLSFQKVSAETKISAKYLKALEEENFNIFPAEVYLKGFLVMYCRYLHLDAEEILKVYKRQYEKSVEEVENTYSAAPHKRLYARPFMVKYGLSVALILLLIFVMMVRAQ